MASFKSHPAYYSLLGILGLAALTAGWGIYNRYEAADKGASRLTQKRSELTALQAVRPAPTVESKAAVEADLHRTETALATMRDQLRVKGGIADTLRKTPPPGGPTEVFFNLETFVERTRQKAEAANVKVKPDERFGFYTYSRTGPDRDLIPQVFRQRQVAEYLLNALIEAGPTELLSLQRERPLSKNEQEAQAAGRAVNTPTAGPENTGATDFFEIDRRISARVPAFVGATAFRISFVAETATLRALLNKLAAFELPLVVRSVEVEPATQGTNTPAAPQANTLSAIFGDAAAPATPAAPEKPKPLVEKILSTFTVTVELIDLVEAPATEATPTT